MPLATYAPFAVNELLWPGDLRVAARGRDHGGTTGIGKPAGAASGRGRAVSRACSATQHEQ
jgi:hypothetical protein